MIDVGVVSKLKFEGDARKAMHRTADKLRVGKAYKLPLEYISLYDKSHPIQKCVCTGKYRFYATFQTEKGVPLSLRYYELIKVV